MARATQTTATPGDNAQLLRAITNLAAFHREHEKFYAAAPREQAVSLQRHTRALQALADRWSSAEPSERTPFSPYEGAEDLNAAAALQLDGVLFMEGEGEPAEISRLKRDVRNVARDLADIGDWLSTAMQASWDMAAALVPVPALADLLGERHRIIANDWQAAGMSALAGRILVRAADVLDHVDFSPAVIRADLSGSRVTPRLLYSAAELIAHAADLLSDSAGLVHDNERRWRVFRARVREIVERLPPA
jgi:hypothetical protein